MAQALIYAFQPAVGQAHPIEEIELVPSKGGAYEISVDRKFVYSKLETGKHISDEDAVALVRAAIA